MLTPSDFDREKLALEYAKFAFDQNKHLRDRWLAQELLVNQRLTWLLASQAFIAAAFAYLTQPEHAIFGASTARLAFLLPAIALGINAMVFLGGGFSSEAQHPVQ